MSGPTQAESMILQNLAAIQQQLAAVIHQLREIREVSVTATVKECYTTTEVAQMMDVTGHTVRERWCNQGRIQCEKDPSTGKWRIPGSEYERLRLGGRPTRSD